MRPQNSMKKVQIFNSYIRIHFLITLDGFQTGYDGSMSTNKTDVI